MKEQKTIKGIKAANDDKPLLVADADYWLTAPKEEVKKFIEENTDIEEYETKKKQLLCEIEKRKSKF